MTFRAARSEQLDDLLGCDIRAGDAIGDRWTREVVADERHLRDSRHAAPDRRQPIGVAERELRDRLIPSEAGDDRRRSVDAEPALKIAVRDRDDLVVAQRCYLAIAAAAEKYGEQRAVLRTPVVEH